MPFVYNKQKPWLPDPWCTRADSQVPGGRTGHVLQEERLHDADSCRSGKNSNHSQHSIRFCGRNSVGLKITVKVTWRAAFC